MRGSTAPRHTPRNHSRRASTPRRKISTARPVRRISSSVRSQIVTKSSCRSPVHPQLTTFNQQPPHTTQHRSFKVSKTDPLNTAADPDPAQSASNASRYTWISSRSADRPLSVLLAGYSTFVGQHLFTHLSRLGIQVIPVDGEPSHPLSRVRVLSMDQVSEQGIPDVDFIVNCFSANIYQEAFTDEFKQIVESVTLESNQFWANQIRSTRSKPYAYINLSSALLYPESSHLIYDETYSLPMSPQQSELSRPEMQAQELSLPYWSRFYRNAEEHARVFIPEIDIRSPEEMEAFRQHQREKMQKEAQSYKILSTFHDTPETLRAESVRRDLLSNSDVRVVNIRCGHLLAREMLEFTRIRRAIDFGILPYVGDGTSIHPWIHIDDAMEMIMFAMFNPDISGPLNAVAPHFATNKELWNFAIKSKKSFNFNMNCSQSTVNSLFGPLVGSTLGTTRKVIPAKAMAHDFKWQYPHIENCLEPNSLSLLEEEIIAAGDIDKIYRNVRRSQRA